MAAIRSRPPVRTRFTALVSIGALLAGLLVALAIAAPAAAEERDHVTVDEDTGRVSVFHSGGYLTEPSSRPAGVTMQNYVRQNRDTFGLSAREVASLSVESSLQQDGVTYVTLEQAYDEISVHHGRLSAVVDSQGRLVIVNGQVSPDDTSGTTKLTAGEAIGIAAERGGAGTKKPPKNSATKGKGKHKFANPYAKGLKKPSQVSAELVWARIDDGLRLSWLTDVEVSGSSWHESVVDAGTGEVLEHNSRYSHAGDEGTVFTGEHPDNSPARAVVPFTGLDGDWAAGTTTSGNNVNAYLDRDNNNANDEYQPSNADAHFNYAFTDAWRNLSTIDDTDFANIPDADWQAAIDADRDAIITQLFYYTNDMHDWLYGFGFNEASGNFQVDNFGRGGSGGDPVLAEAHDGFDFGCQDQATPPNDIRCANNANFSFNPDGTSSRMQMYLWIRPNRPYRDGSMDGDVIAHEYGHGVSNRLIPGGMSAATNQTGSLGEGWSDAISMFRWNDAVVGEYVTGNATRGIRNSAYDVHPWTYGNYSTSVNSPHRNGEIWAATMYDIRTLLGINTTTQVMLDGMRVTAAPNPTFLAARDGILAADQAAGGNNRCALWTAFAGRGMGTDAVSNGLHAVPTEDFTVPAECLPTADAGGPYETPEGTDVTLDGSGSAKGTDPSSGAIAGYEWDFDNDGQYDDATGVSPTFDLVGIHGVRTIGLQVTDAFGNTATDSTTVTVTNVAPSVSINAIAPIDEGGTVTVSGVVSDPGWLTDLSATIDFDDGQGAQALTGVEENNRPDATLTFSVDHTYGDNGTFEVAVTGFDSLTSTTETADAVVANVDPTATIDKSGEQVYDGVSANVLEAGEDLTLPVNATDPGSDDLIFTWLWGDGTSDTETSLVNPPLTDPAKSPSVQPRDVTLEATHAYVDACLYEVGAGVEDDDGGSDSDTATIIVTGNAEQARGHGWWHGQYRTQPPNDYSPETLQCYLDIAVFFSLVFNDPLDRADGERILQAPAKAPETVQFDEKALAAWLNFADGVFKFDTPVDTNGDGTLDSTFGEAMLTAETVRMDPAATAGEIRAQRSILERIILRDD
ncbi:MAG: hypothetical protein GEU86_00135 [Actinophytocola sp.]|nr:hypothetical protein [Actinophytocola sp.]